MQVRTTKVFAAELAKHLRGTGIHAAQKAYSLREYRLYVDCIGDPRPDLDPRTGLYNVILITYPGSYYALPRTITTRDLTSIYRSAPKSWDCFWAAVVDHVRI